jgi:hypothetical protein
MGWVWLGQQGQRLSWSLASGVVAVALWWAVRLVLAQKPLGHIASVRHLSLALGLTTAAGAAWLAHAESGLPAQGGLLVLALVWAVWASTLEQQAQQSPRCQRPWAGWPPMLAALATWAAVSEPAGPQSTGLIVAMVLLGATLLNGITSPQRVPTTRREPKSLSLAETIPPTAMGWMMGSLWLSNAWCASAGLSSQTVVGLHLMLMAVLPALIRIDWLPRHLPALVNRLLPLVLVAVGGALLWAGPALANGMVGMLLLALAWALPARSPQNAHHCPAHSMGQWAALAGPMLLLAIGQWSPSLGPQALSWAYGALGAMASAMAILGALRHEPETTLRPTLSRH